MSSDSAGNHMPAVTATRPHAKCRFATDTATRVAFFRRFCGKVSGKLTKVATPPSAGNLSFRNTNFSPTPQRFAKMKFRSMTPSTNASTAGDTGSQKSATMHCHELAKQILELQPESSPQDVARLCLLLSNRFDDTEPLRDQLTLKEAWKQMGMRLQQATDQHAAMTAELEELAQSNPSQFDQNQIWVLIRAIKVQSQILQMYVGHPLLDV
jgi:hypothetical protein